MKLYELKQWHPGFITDPKEIDEYVRSLTNVWRLNQIQIDSQGRVDFAGAIEASRGMPGFREDPKGKLKYIEVKFNSTTADFRVWDNDLRTLNGCPDHVGGDLIICNNPKLTDINFMPKTVKNIQMDNIGVFRDSLIGIEEVFKNTTFSGKLQLNFQKIEKGGLELINIKGLKGLRQSDRVGDLNGTNRTLPLPFCIIQEYLGRPDDLFECQAELIENGFEEFAKL